MILVQVFLTALSQANTTTATLLPPLEDDEGCDWAKFQDTICLDEIDSEWWGFTIEILILAITFLGLAIVCDEYLVPSLETLCLRMHIREDIAGCTFLAFGSSAPEIIVNSLATLKQTDGSTDLGIGTIIGSGMIAFTLIPGLCGVSGGAEQPLLLKRRPIARDTIGYLAGLTQLVFYFDDGEITTMESAMLVASFVVYILVVLMSPMVRRRFCLSQQNSVLTESSVLLSDATHRGSLNKPKPVRFLDRSGNETIVPVIGPIFSTSKQDIGSDTSALHIKLGNPVTLLVEGDISSRIFLENTGAVRIITDIQDLLQERGILTTMEWEVGSKIEVYNRKTKSFVEGTITGKFLEYNTYSVRPLNPIKKELEHIPFADIRPTQDLLPGFIAKIQNPSSALKSRKNMLLHAYEHGALSEQQYDEAMGVLETKIDLLDDGLSSSSNAVSTVSEFRRKWWKDVDTNGADRPLWKRFFMGFVTTWRCVFKWTIPVKETEDTDSTDDDDGSQEERTFNSRYPFTMIASLMWVALLSFIIGTVAERWADLSGLGTSFVGILLISIGAEVPDCVSSLAVAKRGYGSMAVANSLGSQNINIYIGLGLPWLISNLINQGKSDGDHITIDDPTSLRAAALFQYGGVATNFVLILGVAVAAQASKATLSSKKGYVLVAAYFVVLSGYASYTFAT